MALDTSGLRPPHSADPQAMLRWGMETINQLRRAQQTANETSDLTTETSEALATLANSAQAYLDELIALYGTLTDFGDLTDAEKNALGLSATVADQLALGEDILAAIQPFLSTPGVAAVTAYLAAVQNEASIRVEQTVRETETLSLSNQVTTLTADLASTDAAVVSEQTARATGDAALASDITTVQTTVAGHTTSITQHQASIDGIEAEWGVTINAQGHVVGLVRLDAGATGSTFTVVVDKFQVAKFDGTGIVPIFQIGTVGGASRVALAADMLVDGYIVAQNIASGTITANEIAAGTITAAEIAANTLTANEIAANAITASELAAGSINAGHINAGAVTAAKIDVSALSSIVADIGTITAGKMQSTDGKMVVDLDNKIIKIET